VQERDMVNGLRVQITQEIDLYPIGKFEPGLLGTVEAFGGDGVTEPYCLVKLDLAFPTLEHWGNRLQVWDEAVPIVTAADFKVIGPFED
jgi:hypothetical protein